MACWRSWIEGALERPRGGGRLAGAGGDEKEGEEKQEGKEQREEREGASAATPCTCKRCQPRRRTPRVC